VVIESRQSSSNRIEAPSRLVVHIVSKAVSRLLRAGVQFTPVVPQAGEFHSCNFQLALLKLMY
jgi:hypothetical protein